MRRHCQLQQLIKASLELGTYLDATSFGVFSEKEIRLLPPFLARPLALLGEKGTPPFISMSGDSQPCEDTSISSSKAYALPPCLDTSIEFDGSVSLAYYKSYIHIIFAH